MNYCASHRVFTAEAYKGKKSNEKYCNIFCTPLLGVSVPPKITIHSIMKQTLTGSLLQKRERGRRVPSDVTLVSQKARPRKYSLLEYSSVTGFLTQ